MSKPIIAVDIDDVLADGTDSLRQEVNKRLGVDLQREHYSIPGDYWGYYERVWQNNDLIGRISMAELSPQMEQDQSHIPVIDGVGEAMQTLSQQHDLVIITSRLLTWEKATHRWLDDNFPGLFRDVVFTNGKAGLEKKNKGQICRDLGAQWLIDDNVEHAQAAIAEGVSVILYGEYGWHYAAPKNVKRCKSWADVLEYFNEQG